MPLRLTPAVKAILIACFAAFVIQHTADQFMGANLLYVFGLVPSAFLTKLYLWQIFTYPFLHADVMHLFLNMLMLAFIGGELEAIWGVKRFVRFFFICSVSAGFLYLILQAIFWGGGQGQGVMVGASGAIYGLLMAYGVLFSERVLLFMMLFPMKAKHFVWVLALVEFMSTVFSGRGGLSSAAHLGGMVAGFVSIWGGAAFRVMSRQWKEKSDARAEAARKEKRRKASQHLKLVINNPKDPQNPKAPKGPSGGGDPGDDNKPTWH